MQPPEDLDAKVWAALLGGIGAVISMQFVKGLGWRQKTMMVFTGVILAVVFTPVIMDWMSLPQTWSDGIAALIGILGWASVGTVIVSIQKADLWDLVRDSARRLIDRIPGRGGQ